ncbi:MAG: caspase family protein [Tannerella sp.]|jgi:hypothetical protein|nr:caspase family protein [Tannerella sp.]
MNRIKFTGIIILLFVGNVIYAQTFHAIIFADSDDPKIGRSVFNDYYNMQAECATIAAANNMKLKEYHYVDAECSKTNAEKVLQDLNCGPQDIVFFYYSGHGGRAYDDKSKFPQLSLSPGDAGLMPLYRIDEMMASKHPKFRIIMADCCNSYVPGITPKDKDLGGAKSVLKDQTAEIYQNLFGRLHGSIVVSSSQAGETSSAVDDGGAFTLCFLKELQKIVAGNSRPDWNALLNNTKTETYNWRSHTPVYDINVTDNPNTGQPVDIQTPQTSNSFISELIKIADNHSDELIRINLVKPALDNYFASPAAIVEIYGRNGKTLLTRENAKDFLQRISTSIHLISFVEISSQKNENGKITFLKLHEIYKQ